MKISIFGLGYVGCVSMGCLAKDGYHVIGIDLVDSKIEMINNGKATIVEKDIDELIYEQWKQGKIRATKDFMKAVNETDVSIICVGTPSTNEGHLNLEAVFNTAKQIGKGLKEKNKFHVIAIRSTVLPGTNFKVGKIIEKFSKKKRNIHFGVASNPEFMREGTSIQDYYNPPYIILGSDSAKAIKVMQNIYSNINVPIEKTEIEIAEIIKFVNNSFHALKITFANEIGNICKRLKIDSHKLMDIFCKDRRLNISPYYLRPGFAYGGSCLPKDLKALRTIAHDFYLNSPILESIEASNKNQIDVAFNMVVNKGKKKIGILGLSFKKGTDDLRNSPAVELAEKLLGKGYEILIYDDKVNLSRLTGKNKEFISKRIPHISKLISDNLENVVSNSELLIVTNDDKIFKDLEKKFPDKIIIDLIRISKNKSSGNYNGICW